MYPRPGKASPKTSMYTIRRKNWIFTLTPESSFPINALSNVVFPDPGDPNSRVILQEKKKGGERSIKVS
jgi:hypothetical protein